MGTTLESRTITVAIARAWQDVYDFISVPENFPRWASGAAKSLKRMNGEWIAEALEGPVSERAGWIDNGC